MDLGDFQELMDTTSEELAKDDLMQMRALESVPDNEEKDAGAVPDKLTSAIWWRALLIQVRAKAAVAQSCPTLCDPKDCSPPGSSAHGILQATILGCVATPFSR